jgi:hypothetical protein
MKSPKKDRTRPKPLVERMQDAAEAGNPQSVIDSYEKEPINPDIYWPDYQRSLRQALENAADTDPAAAVRFLLNRILSFDATLMIRAQHIVKRELDRYDSAAPQNDGNFPDHIVTEWLPRIERLQSEVKDGCLVYAKIWHVLELAEARARKSGKVIPFVSGKGEQQDGKDDDAAAAAR